MDFALTEEQRQIHEAFARCFHRECTIERVRAAEPLGFDPDLAKQLWAMGAASMGVPERNGGGGAGLLELTLVAEEFGRHLGPVPLVEAMVATRLLAAVADTDLLPAALDGTPLLTLAVRPAGSPGLEADPGVDASGDTPDVWACLVPAGAVADGVIGLDGGELVACDGPPRIPGASNLGSAPLADRALSGAAAGHRRVLAGGPAAVAAYGKARREWQVLTAAAVVGVAAGALDLAVAYVQDRRQFGARIATFQSVAHRLADCATALDGARLLARSAADAADAGDRRAPVLADMAFAFAAEQAEKICSESLHFHGGYGFMLEYDVQLFFRRAKAWTLAGGDPRLGYVSVADQLTLHGA